MDFESAADNMRNLTKKPNDDELLEVYALYKQSIVGDCNTSKPGMLDLSGKAKWEKWNSLKGLSQDNAKEKYIALAQNIMTKYGA